MEFLEYLVANKPEEVEKIELAGPGFINFHLSRKFFSGSVEEILNNKNFGNNELLKDQKIMVEYINLEPGSSCSTSAT